MLPAIEGKLMETENKKSVTLVIAWVLLLIMGLLMILGGTESMIVAFRGANETIAGTTSQALSAINPDLPGALHGRRLTAATYALSCGLFVVWITMVPFRRREKWAWYALLCSVGLGSTLSALRAPLMGIRTGVEVPAVTLIVLLIALVISYRDFK